MKPLTREEIFAKVKGANKRSQYQVSWITDILPVTDYKDPETGEISTINVTVVAKTTVRFNIQYKNIASVIRKGDLASRTVTAGSVKTASRKVEPWWKHIDGTPSICYHKADETLSDDTKRWYIQMFAASRTNKDPITGKFIKGTYKVVPELEYVFMMGTPDEEVLPSGSPKELAVIDALSKMRPVHEKPAECWFKKIDSILAIDHK